MSDLSDTVRDAVWTAAAFHREVLALQALTHWSGVHAAEVIHYHARAEKMALHEAAQVIQRGAAVGLLPRWMHDRRPDWGTCPA